MAVVDLKSRLERCLGTQDLVVAVEDEGEVVKNVAQVSCFKAGWMMVQFREIENSRKYRKGFSFHQSALPSCNSPIATHYSLKPICLMCFNFTLSFALSRVSHQHQPLSLLLK